MATGQSFDPMAFLGAQQGDPLRMQAIDLFDRCLTEGNPAPIIAFIERQVTGEPPHLQLLRDFGEELQRRLLSLRTNQFDMRIRVVQSFADYGIDITPLMPANAVEHYHQIAIQGVIDYAQSLSANDRLLLIAMVELSIKTAARLNDDIKLTADLQRLVTDWLEALSSTVGRRYWSQEPPAQSPIH